MDVNRTLSKSYCDCLVEKFGHLSTVARIFDGQPKLLVAWIRRTDLQFANDASRSRCHNGDPLRQIHALVYAMCNEHYSTLRPLPDRQEVVGQPCTRDLVEGSKRFIH